MNLEHIQYAKRLEVIGDLIVQASNLIGLSEENEITTKNEVVNTQYQLSTAIERYEFCQRELLALKSPSVVVEEHKSLVDAIGIFIEGTKMMKDSFSVEPIAVNKEKLIKGRELQKKGEVQVGIIVDKIVNKLK